MKFIIASTFALAFVTGTKLNIAPIPAADRASIDFNDAKRQEHSDRVIDHLGNRIFTDAHDSLRYLHDSVIRQASANERDGEPGDSGYPRRAKQ